MMGFMAHTSAPALCDLVRRQSGDIQPIVDAMSDFLSQGRWEGQAGHAMAGKKRIDAIVSNIRETEFLHSGRIVQITSTGFVPVDDDICVGFAFAPTVILKRPDGNYIITQHSQRFTDMTALSRRLNDLELCSDTIWSGTSTCIRTGVASGIAPNEILKAVRFAAR